MKVRAFHRGEKLPADWFDVVDTDVRFNVACIGVHRPGFIEIRPLTATSEPLILEVGLFIRDSSWDVSIEPGLLVSREPFTPEQLSELGASG